MRAVTCFRRFFLLMLIFNFAVIAGVMFNVDRVESAEINAVTNPLLGKWGYERIMHLNNGSWSTRGGIITYNNDGTGTDNYQANDYGTLGSGTETFIYTIIPNQDGSITVAHTFPDNTTRVRKYVVSDDGKMTLMDGTEFLDRQLMRIAVRLDSARIYNNADLNGPRYYSRYLFDTSGGDNVACSGIIIADGNGGQTNEATCNVNDVVSATSGQATYSISPDGSFTLIDSNLTGYLMWDGIGLVTSHLNTSTTWSIAMALKKQDAVYSTSDLAGTWVIEGFGDDNGNSYSSKFGILTCDSNGNCVGKMKNQRDGNMSYETGNIKLTVASDGSFGTSLGDVAPYYAGAIGNNGNTMVFNVSFDSTTLWHREIYVGARCSKCQSTEFPIAETSNKELSRGMAFDGTNYLVGFHDDVIDPYISAQLISQDGLSVGQRITINRTGGSPIVAFDGTNYLMVWEDDTTGGQTNRDIYGQFISKSGTLVGSYFPITTVAGNQSPDGVVFDGTNYLVTWTDERNDLNGNGSCDNGEGTCGDIYGQFITTAGALLGSEMPIVDGAENQLSSGVAFDGTNYLVAWQDRRVGIDEHWDIYGRFISKTGTLSAPFIISENPSRSYNYIVSIAFDGTNYLVVWNRDVGLGYPNPMIWDIYGRLVSPAGTFPGFEFPITTSVGDQIFPYVSFDGSNYLVTWSDGRNDLNGDGICNVGEGTCMDIYGQYLSKSGVLAGPEVHINTDYGNQVVSPVLFDGERHFIVWNNVETFDGPVGDVYGQFLMKTMFEESDPVITYTGTWKNYTCATCSGGAMKYSGQTGAKADFSFNGTGIKWIVTKANLLGKARVYLDGVSMGLVDLYNPTPKYKVALQKTGLTPGNHTITIEVSGQKNPASAGSLIGIDAFEVVP